MVSYVTSTPSFQNICYNNMKSQIPTTTQSVVVVTRRTLSLLTPLTATATAAATTSLSSFPVLAATPEFTELPQSGGVKALDLRIGDGDTPRNGDQVQC